MKRTVLFAATMLLCAGMAFAQSPVKKNTKETVKSETSSQAAAKDSKDSKTPSASEKKDCGKCPNHKQCCKEKQGNGTLSDAPDQKANNSKKETPANKKEKSNAGVKK